MLRSAGISLVLAALLTNLSDFVPTLGAGAGVLWDVGKSGGMRRDFSLRYLRSGEADYLKDGALRRWADGGVLMVSRSRTDMVLMHVGVNFGR